MAWTRNELTKQMRAAGWTRMPGPGGVYTHPNGGRVNLDGYVAEMGLVWRFYAEREEVPMMQDQPAPAGGQS